MSLTKIKGTLVNLNVITDLLTDSGLVDEWQVVLSKKNNDPLEVDELHVSVSLRDPEDETIAAEKLAGQIQEASEVRPSTVSLVGREEMLQRLGMETQLKEARVVDLRDSAGKDD
tara:strand:- start:89 stop:433 length:345 start_codon:yes stop_codon:yes gene_type:complete